MRSEVTFPADRVTFRDGQRLDARDLRDAVGRERLLRQLHTATLHGTWGIALGLEVREVEGRAVVDPGYAIDADGRELLLAAGFEPQIPRLPVPEVRVLTARYRENACFRSTDGEAALCLGEHNNARRERPAFAWRRQDEVRFGPEIPLVQAQLADGKVAGELDFRVRRFTRPFVRPHMAQGTVEAGRGAWREWRQGEQLLGLEVVVDTSEAGFTRTPFYFASLTGDFGNRDGEDEITTSDVWGGASPTFGLDSVSFLSAASRDSFTYRLLAGGLPLGAPASAASAEGRGFTVTWLGLEPVRGCEPPLHVTFWFHPAGFRIVHAASVILNADS